MFPLRHRPMAASYTVMRFTAAQSSMALPKDPQRWNLYRFVPTFTENDLVSALCERYGSAGGAAGQTARTKDKT